VCLNSVTIQFQFVKEAAAARHIVPQRGEA
jgi:hypothetical protein